MFLDLHFVIMHKLNFTVKVVSVKNSKSKLSEFWHENLRCIAPSQSFGSWNFAITQSRTGGVLGAVPSAAVMGARRIFSRG